MLTTLPNLVFPITVHSMDPLMTNMVQLNLVDGCLSRQQQRAMGIFLHKIDLFVKSNGYFNYLGKGGTDRLKRDAYNFCRDENALQRHGELAAAHLAIDYHDTVTRIQTSPPIPGFSALPNSVNGLLPLFTDLVGISDKEEQRIGLFLDYAGKKPAA